MPDLIAIGVPYWIGRKDEYTGSVEAVRDSALMAELGLPWVEIEPDFESAPDPVTAVNRAIAAVIRAHAGKVPLIFAGDCTSCIGAVAGLQDRNPAVIWYDAHGDFNTPETTPSGFLGGMPLAALVGRGNEALMKGVGLKPLRERDIIITDARDLDPEEGEMLRDSDLVHLPEIDALLTVSLPDKPLYIHFDGDVLRLEDLPAVSYPAEGGPTLDETLATVRRLVAEAPIAGVLFSLWNHKHPGAAKSQESTLTVIRAVVSGLSG